MRDANWMLVDYYDADQAELYDLSADSSEHNDLATREPARLARMRTALADWRKSVNAQENRPNPAFDPVRYRELYLDVDASRFEAEHASQTQWETIWRWRKAMDAVVASSQKPKP